MINIKDHQIVIHTYQKILSVHENEIFILIKKNIWKLYGENLKIVYLSKDEIEIKGIIKKVEIDYE